MGITLDLSQTDEFIKNLYQEANPVISIHCIKNGVWSENMETGKYKDLRPNIEYANKNKYDVYLLVNPSYTTQRLSEHLKKSFCYFIDIDEAQINGGGTLPDIYHVPPSCICEREDQKGYHVYWFLKEPLIFNDKESLENWSTVQTMAIDFYKSDGKIKDPGRIMRLPGTYNWKQKVLKEHGRPLLYNIIECNTTRYTNEDFINGFKDLKVLRPKVLKKIATRRKKYEDSTTGKIVEGARNDFLLQAGFIFNDYGFTKEDILKELTRINKKDLDNPLSEDEIKGLAESSVKYGQNTKGLVAAEDNLRLAKKVQHLKEFFKDWYFIHADKRFIDINKIDRHYDESSFNKMFSHVVEIIHPSNFCFLHNIIKRAEQFVYEPTMETLIKKENEILINLWKKPDLKPIKKKPTWFINHVKYLLPKPEDHEYIFDFFAHMVQKPREKIRHALILIGSQGVGKSFLIDLFRQIFGETNIKKPSNDDLSDKYSGWAKECQLCFIDEIEQADKKSFINKIKPIISEDTIRVREMFKDSYQINNYMSIFATTNDIHPVLLDKDDRRFMIFKSNAKPRGKTYYEKFIRARDNRAGEVLHFLASRDISAFHAGARPPMTDAKQDIIGYSRNDLVAEIEELVEAKEHPFDKDVVFIEDIKDFFVLEKRMHRITLNRITKVFQNLGFVNESQTRVNINGAYRRSWIIRNFDRWLDALGDGTFIQDVKSLYDESGIDDDKIVSIS